MTASELFAEHDGHHCRPPGPVTLFFRRVIAAMRRKPAAAPAVCAGAAPAPAPAAERFPCCFHCHAGSPCEPRDSHPEPCAEGCNDVPTGIIRFDGVLGDAMLSQVRDQWNAWHDDDRPSFTPARPVFTPSDAMTTGEFAVLDAKVDAVLRSVNGRNLGTQPRRQAVYGERPQLEVERDMARAAGERARQGYVPASPRLLDQVLAGLRKL